MNWFASGTRGVFLVADEELVEAIRAHRLAVGEAYGVGSFRAQHAANVALWSLVAEEPTRFTGDWDLPASGLDEAELARPAHLEDEDPERGSE